MPIFVHQLLRPWTIIWSFWDFADGKGWPLLQELRELLEKEIGRCEALLEAESERSKCKWPILTMARLLELRDFLNAQQGKKQLTSPSPSMFEALSMPSSAEVDRVHLYVAVIKG